MAGKTRYALIFLLIALCLGGCRRNSEAKKSRTYTIYYTNLAGTRLEEKSYIPTSDKFEGILKELLEQFQYTGYSDVNSALPQGVGINGYTIGVDDLQVDFDAGYLSISNVQEVLLRAGLVKTLVQLRGVLSVRFTVDGQPLTDGDGREVSAMNADTFIDSKEDGINSYHFVALELYFANQSGNRVVKEMRNGFYSSNLIMEKVIVEQIIRGPANKNLLPVADPATLVKNVRISGGVCIIDLDSRFNNAPANVEVDPETCLYAFVNAICDACDVEGVRFRIDGESDVRFRGQVNLDQVFHRNADLIEASGTVEALEEVFLDEESTPIETQESEAAVQSTAEETDRSSAEKETENDMTDEQGSSSGNTGSSRGVGVDPALVEENP